MSCGNGCGCCPKCGCRATCTCNRNIWCDEDKGDFSYIGKQTAAGAKNIRSANSGYTAATRAWDRSSEFFSVDTKHGNCSANCGCPYGTRAKENKFF